MRRTLVVTFATGIILSATLFGWLHGYITAPAPLVFGHDRVEFMRPRFLYALATIPFIIPGLAVSLANLPLQQRLLSLLMRACMLASLCLALAGPARTTDATRVSTIFAVDVSDSVSDDAIEEARTHIQSAWRARGDNDVQVLTFARRAQAIPVPSDDTANLTLARHDNAHGGGSATDLQAALHLAYGLFPQGHLRRLVIFSDGGQTDGNLLAEASRAAAFNTTIYVHPYQTPPPAEIALEALDIPGRIEVGAPFEVRATIHATRAARGRVRLYQGATLNGLQSVRALELAPGRTEVTFRSVVQVPGTVTYTARLEPESSDRFEANNRVTSTAVVPGQPRVLYVEGVPGRASYLARALSAGRFAVEVRTARGLPTEVRELERYRFVILSDVPADAVSAGQQDAIERYVRDFGGGFLMAGGEQGFGLGGWQNTRIARLLPVHLDGQRRRDQPSLAIALVIDKSGSMSGQKIQLAKEAAIATAEMLGPEDYISVVGFDAAPNRVVRMQSARNRIRIIRDIGRLTARGGTAIFPALDMAFQDLAATRARIKHVILLTDGQTQEQGIPELVRAMRAEGITVSTVGLGGDVQRALLQEAAALGGGRAYFTEDPHNIPRIFTRETSTVARSNVVEEYFQPNVQQPADFLRGLAMRRAPYLHGYVATRARGAPAQVILQTDLGEPLLARWRAGLGWSLAWTSDVKNRWAVDWVRWSGFSQFWSQLVREHMRQERRQMLDLRTVVEDDSLRIEVDALSDEDIFLNALESTVHVRGPMQGDSPTGNVETRVDTQVPLRQTAPGHYETRIPLHQYGSFLVSARHHRDGRLVAISEGQVHNPYPREYRHDLPDHTLLVRSAILTSGQSEPSLNELFDPGDERIETHEALWSYLLLLSLVFLMLDLLLRRVRLFDRQFQQSRF